MKLTMFGAQYLAILVVTTILLLTPASQAHDESPEDEILRDLGYDDQHIRLLNDEEHIMEVEDKVKDAGGSESADRLEDELIEENQSHDDHDDDEDDYDSRHKQQLEILDDVNDVDEHNEVLLEGGEAEDYLDEWHKRMLDTDNVDLYQSILDSQENTKYSEGKMQYENELNKHSRGTFRSGIVELTDDDDEIAKEHTEL